MELEIPTPCRQGALQFAAHLEKMNKMNKIHLPWFAGQCGQSQGELRGDLQRVLAVSFSEILIVQRDPTCQWKISGQDNGGRE